jgi:hypothetical protein
VWPKAAVRLTHQRDSDYAGSHCRAILPIGRTDPVYSRFNYMLGSFALLIVGRSFPLAEQTRSIPAFRDAAPPSHHRRPCRLTNGPLNSTEEIVPSIRGVGLPRGGGAFYQELDSEWLVLLLVLSVTIIKPPKKRTPVSHCFSAMEYIHTLLVKRTCAKCLWKCSCDDLYTLFWSQWGDSINVLQAT